MRSVELMTVTILCNQSDDAAFVWVTCSFACGWMHLLAVMKVDLANVAARGRVLSRRCCDDGVSLFGVLLLILG